MAPITTTLGFLECDVEMATSAFFKWQTAIREQLGQFLDIRSCIAPSLEILLQDLLPLNSGISLRHLFVPTHSQWTAYFDNGWCGSDPASVCSFLAEKIGCRGIRTVWSSHTLKGNRGQLGATIFEVYDRTNAVNNIKRSIALVHDGYKWDFEMVGTPFPFEQTDRYKAKYKMNRFSSEMLDSYLRELNINAFSEDYYLATEKFPARLISIQGKIPKSVTEHSLYEAQNKYD